jgi:hypothetical protein
MYSLRRSILLQFSTIAFVCGAQTLIDTVSAYNLNDCDSLEVATARVILHDDFIIVIARGQVDLPAAATVDYN